MSNDYGNNRSLDEMVMVEEERKRNEEAKRKKAELERKSKEREEAKRKRDEAEKRRKARNERREQSEKHRNIAESTNFDTENSFSPKPNNGGIIKPKFNSITEIKDAQKTQKTLIDDLHKKQWNDLSTGTDEIQIINQKNVDKAKQGLIDLDHELTASYGLGDGGYWNENMQLDDEVNSIGQQPMKPSQKVVQPTSKPSTSYTSPKNNFEADDWAMHGKPPQRDAYNSVIPGSEMSDEQSGGRSVSLQPNAEEAMYIGVDNEDDYEVSDREGEARYDESTNELFSTIKQYYLDKFDPDTEIGDFRKKYPDGSQEIQIWTDELRKKIGKDAADMFLNSCMKVGEKEENISEKANRIIDTVSQYFWDKSNRNISDE